MQMFDPAELRLMATKIDNGLHQAQAAIDRLAADDTRKQSSQKDVDAAYDVAHQLRKKAFEINAAQKLTDDQRADISRAKELHIESLGGAS